MTIDLSDQVSTIYAEANAARDSGDLQTAHAKYTQCVQLNGAEPAYHLSLAICCNAIAQKVEPLKEQAMLHAQQAAKIAPEIVGMWIGLAEISLANNRFPESIAAFEQAISMDTKNARLYGLCGFAYARMTNNAKALEMYTKAVEIDPDMGDVHFLLSCLYAGDNFNPAKQAFHGERGFLAKRPARLSVESCWNAAHGYLGCGDYQKGWQYFESRHNPNLTNRGQILASQRFTVPMWAGQTHVTGADDAMRVATVRISSEHGLGDAFFCARYIPVVIATGVKVILEVHKSMIDLMRFNFPAVACIEFGAAGEDIDYHLPMMSLPFVLKCKKAYWDGAYLQADPAKIDEWADAIVPGIPNIGIVWAGGKRSYNAENNETNRRRSVPFELIAPLLKTEGVNFVSLQVDEQEPFPNPGINDFSDTAALISLCDLVISVDSSVANLVGAMGRPLWLLDRFDHCWRWFGESAWYPETTIFRQYAPDTWPDVLQRVQLSLSRLRDSMAA